MKLKQIIVALAALCSMAASAQTSINLANYQVTGNYALDALGKMGLEASAVTYARDRGTLFFVGDEGLGVVEISKTGQTLGSMAFDWTGTASSNNDAEGLTYLGNGQLVVVDERPQIAYQFAFSNGGSVMLNNQPKVAIMGSTTSVKNVGTEGISYDPLTGKFYSVKQDDPAQLRESTLSFAVGGGTASTTILNSGASSLFGLNSLSDIQTLSPVDALTGTAAADNLLILSLDSKKLVELDRATGTVLSSFDLSDVTTQAIEGVTVDEKGTIYLVAEDSGTTNSRLFVLTAVPEPETYAMLLAGLGLVGFAARRRK
ncbi:FxDxF family PEP-CTERM protein [Ferribacterium limneticum]|uniref:FxDxF family PEP-CTERM protein n=1 Tax=Ferribacterium limneticum TaxID=76259 RepID=UPI001CFA1D81|nr:FxDxF family PEP-CTERM protein [Ferribacterium limneticum]UCV29456.1 FxDxF family PEP-CTERM protein [Ferribacterium limneticum]UCV33375.1 FxDxF family PEP-CTERM protein [Ferribacterium limneticum]